MTVSQRSHIFCGDLTSCASTTAINSACTASTLIVDEAGTCTPCPVGYGVPQGGTECQLIQARLACTGCVYPAAEGGFLITESTPCTAFTPTIEINVLTDNTDSFTSNNCNTICGANPNAIVQPTVGLCGVEVGFL